VITSTSYVLKQSGPGYRLTYFDSAGEPVASFWATTKKDVYAMSAKHVVQAPA